MNVREIMLGYFFRAGLHWCSSLSGILAFTAIFSHWTLDTLTFFNLLLRVLLDILESAACNQIVNVIFIVLSFNCTNSAWPEE